LSSAGFASRPLSAPRFLALGIALLSLTANEAPAGGKTVISIRPGPRSITPEERSLAQDPSRGAEHGFILLDETERDESVGVDSSLTYHLRAKIFSSQARKLADLEVPYNRDEGVLKKWWAWTLLPDGGVLELKREDLKEQEVMRSGGFKIAVLKGSLPGVVPGCIIDYGYSLTYRGYLSTQRVEIQQSFPILDFRYRWIPWEGRAATYHVAHATGLGVNTVRDQRSVLVTGKDLPAILEEPWMPPADEVGASATLYYRATADKPEEFWKLESKRLLRRADAFAKKQSIEQALTSMKISEQTELPARLKAAYDWLSKNVRNRSLLMNEEAEAEDEDDKKEATRRTAKEVLEQKEGEGRELDFLFYGVARALGAEANLVLTTDRTDHYFDPVLLTVGQSDWTLVAVRGPGEPLDKATYVDLGSGLPYGDIPWWVSGAQGFLAEPAGYQMVMLDPSEARRNVSEAHAKIVFDPQDGTAKISWSMDGLGQQGLSERRAWRTLNPADRQKRLDEYCGATGDLEISRAEAPGLQDLQAGFHVDCDGTLLEAHFRSDLGQYSFRWDGAWIESVPELTSTSRRESVVFNFPRIDHTSIEVVAPPGFVPTALPKVAPIESPFGRYNLFLTVTPEGCQVERLFALTALAVPAKDYEPLRRFLAEVHQADATPLVFQKAAGRP